MDNYYWSMINDVTLGRAVVNIYYWVARALFFLTKKLRRAP